MSILRFSNFYAKQNFFTRIRTYIDIPEKQFEVQEMETTEPLEVEAGCNSKEENTSQKREEPSKSKRKRKPKHFNKPLTPKVCW